VKTDSEKPDCVWSVEWENANPGNLGVQSVELVTGIARGRQSARVCVYPVTKGQPTYRTCNVQFAPRADADPKGLHIVSGSLSGYV
jgi:hypothetical protein